MSKREYNGENVPKYKKGKREQSTCLADTLDTSDYDLYPEYYNGKSDNPKFSVTPFNIHTFMYEVYRETAHCPHESNSNSDEASLEENKFRKKKASPHRASR